MPGVTYEDLLPLRESIGRLLAADRRLRSRDFQHKGEGPHHAHLRAMFFLMKEGKATAGAVAKAADLNPASVTAMLDQLEAKGLIERTRDSHDRRQTWISLTDTGRAAAEAKERKWWEITERAFADLTPEEVATGSKVMEALSRAMEELMDSIPHGPEDH